MSFVILHISLAYRFIIADTNLEVGQLNSISSYNYTCNLTDLYHGVGYLSEILSTPSLTCLLYFGIYVTIFKSLDSVRPIYALSHYHSINLTFIELFLTIDQSTQQLIP
jgi:hypothetical protein